MAWTLRVTTFRKSHPDYATHYYGTVRDENGEEKLTVLQSASRQRVIEIAERDCAALYGNVTIKVLPGIHHC